MLKQLYLENFLIIEQASVNFGEGLNVITGETGSGKSMIFEAIGLLLGGKGGRDYIRTGADKLLLEGVFEVRSEALDLQLREMGYDLEEGDLFLSREISESGKSIYRLGARMVPAGVVKALADSLVDISGQHEHQMLLSPSNYISLIDEFGQETLNPFLSEVSEAASAVFSLETALKQFDMDPSEVARRMDFLQYQLEELDEAALKEGEEEALEETYSAMKHFERIALLVSQIEADALSEDGYLSQISKTRRQLEELSQLQHRWSSLAEQLEEGYLTLESAIHDLVGSFDPSEQPEEQEIAKIESRMAQIFDLRRKYGGTIQEILTSYKAMKAELDSLAYYNDEKAALQIKHETALKHYHKLDEALTGARQTTAEHFSKALHKELLSLGFEGLKLELTAVHGTTVRSTGSAHIQWLIATNPGEPLKELRKIVSGGELSRIMLAVKLVNRHARYASTQIFDEIDSGISGRTASRVAEKLVQIAEDNQVILVTHLPQIASKGNAHFVIEKKVDQDRTFTKVHQASGEQRVEEIARMIGGGEVNDTALEHARSLLT
ncbi:DNA repair protein RecN [Acidaminobacter hydrogenoformans]|uniref:DNA repair protein RecN n=1 Tax=Acidaminobacter hydrogenoformans DSM 2784 TaxID=1120920 RepID=A0A1G5S6N0_9FIRM|nr:DNA repair protein RecN [Acidaminobacter hydrogenoformans]SCZ82032.1 DNA repair protein RecN (Recombination protein N) [Acidaminobacter hydrogenoformans DSM 2784]